MKRRQFLKSATCATAAIPYLFSFGRFARYGESSPIAVAFLPDAIQTLEVVDAVPNFSFRTNPVKVAAMVDAVILKLTGKSSLGAAWESLFPAGKLTASTKIAIKINNSYGFDKSDKGDSVYIEKGKYCPWGSKADIANAIVCGLTQMLGGTFPVSNITIFDIFVTHENTKAFIGLPLDIDPKRLMNQGFPIDNTLPYDVKEPGAPRVVLSDRNDPSDLSFTSNGKTFRLVKPLAEADFWINVPVLKSHFFSGITSSLKNTYGCAGNCVDTHFGGAVIENYICDFYAGTIGLRPCIVQILDALTCLYDGGPCFGPVTKTGIIAASLDPMAIENYCLGMVSKARTDNGMHAIEATTGNNGDNHVQARYLRPENLSKYRSLGNFSSDLRWPAETISLVSPNQMPSMEISQSRLLNCIREGNTWTLGLLMDKSGRQHRIESRLVDMNNREIRSWRTLATAAPKYAISWDRKDNRGLTVTPGVFSWQVRIDGRSHHRIIDENC